MTISIVGRSHSFQLLLSNAFHCSLGLSGFLRFGILNVTSIGLLVLWVRGHFPVTGSIKVDLNKLARNILQISLKIFTLELWIGMYLRAEKLLILVVFVYVL